MRNESLVFKLRLNADQADSPHVRVFTPVHVKKDDTLNLTWILDINYFGGVEEKLNALLEILQNDSVIIQCSHQEIRKGRCLIERVLDKIKQVEAKYV